MKRRLGVLCSHRYDLELKTTSIQSHFSFAVLTVSYLA